MKSHINILTRKALRFVGYLSVMVLFLGVITNTGYAQQTTPPANTTIGNQASATYEDNNGNARTVTSNTVETTVQQVAAVSITQGITKQVSPGNQVLFPHTVTNSGNGSDSFTLTTSESGNNFSFDNIAVYEDANSDGVPDDLSSPITSTSTLAAGETFSYIVVVDVPTTAADGVQETISVTANSVFDPSVTATASPANTAVISESAVVNVIKSLTNTSGTTGDQITVTLQYTNNGNADASNLVVNDPLPAGFEYVTGSGQVSSAAVTDSDDSDSYEYDASGNGGNGEISVNVGTLASGQQGTITFDVTIGSGTEGQTIANTANYNHDDINQQNTNTSQYSVDHTYSIETVDNDGTDDDIREKGPVSQGATVNFENTFKNTGSTLDRFNITLSGQGNYPAGTTFKLFKSDGSGNPTSPITDSNNDGEPDVGPIAANTEFEVVVQVQLPSNASGSGPFDLTVTATSVNDTNESATFTDRLTAITASSVDLTNNAAEGQPGASGEGVNPTGETNPVTTNSNINPGSTTSFTLFVKNTSGSSDNFNLAASQVGNFSQGLPTGWSVQFQDASNGNVITNTGSIASGSSIEINAIISVPEGASPGSHSIYFRAKSTATGATDVKHDAVDINTVRKLSLVSSQSGQIAPGATIIYTHTLTNEGNVAENNGTNSRIQLNLANSEASGFQGVVYVDEDNSGTINSGDTQVTTASGGSAVLPASVGTLQNGDQVKLLVRITGTPGVSDGTSNTTTLTAEDDGSGQAVNGEPTSSLTVNVEDITTIVAGNLVIEKKQRKQGGGSYVTTDLGADPGDIVEYQIVVTNQGSAPVSNVVVTDNTPAYTTQEGAVSVSGAANNSDITSEPGDGNSGTIKISLSSLAAGNSFTVEFAVQIDN
jgi:uncharacterized repeat protein (TIGR01451 family)